MKIFKPAKKDVFIWCVLFLMLLVFCNARILNISPFGYSFAFALSFCGFNSIITGIIYFFCNILQGFNFVNLICTSFVFAILVILSIIKLTSKKQNIFFILACCLFSQIAGLYFSITNWVSVLLQLLNICVGVLFCYICCNVVQTILARGVQCITSTQKCLVSVISIALFLGLCNLNISGLDVSKFIFTLFILCACVAIKQKTVFVACLISLAVIFSGNQQFAINYFLFACAGVWLTPKSKFLSASAVCLIDSALGLFLDYNLISLIPCLCSALIFVCIKSKYLTKIGEYIYGSYKPILGGYYVQKKEELIKSKLSSIGDMFLEMQRCYRGLIIPSETDYKVYERLALEIKNEVCENCINKMNCYTNKDMSPCFAQLLERASQKGKVNFLDVPNLLSSNCNRLNACLSSINLMAEELNAKKQLLKESDETKLNISLQLGGTSKIFKDLSLTFDKVERINAKKSKQIIDQILNAGMVCKECHATEDISGVSEISVIVRSVDAVNPALVLACQKVYPIKFERKLCYQTKIAGWSLVVLVPLARYELLCGYASLPKNVGDKCGDNYVYTKLTDSKYLVAICDGMGHGEDASNISAVAINLIQSYYKCGLSSSVVIDTVNNLLLPSGGKFTTLDATIIDTSTGEVDFIKIGSSISVVKSADQSKIIGVESLPLGVIEGVKPTTSTVMLYAGDIAVIASDGIVDVFASPEEFCNYINNERIINMQLFAESILEEAQSRSLSHKDDMTVIAYRLVNKR